MKNKILIVLSVILFAAVFFWLGAEYNTTAIVETPIPSVSETTVPTSTKPAGVDFNTFWTVWNLVHSQYVDNAKLKDPDLLYGAIDGMVQAVGDPYTTFLRPQDSESLMQQISGSFSGVGIEIGIRNSVLTVISPIKDSPAERAGVIAGDKILKIDGKDSSAMNQDEAVKLIRGPNGTTVKLTTERGNPATEKEFTIVRTVIKIPAAKWSMLDGNTAYLQVFIFNKNIDSEFKKAAKEITESKATKIILDLRNNPGGLLDSAVSVASYFLDTGQAVLTEKFGDGRQDAYKSEANGILKNYPIVVLINKGSASASEILAGALRDNRNVTIIGETSYGKGSVQVINDLPNKSSVKITIAKWYTPKGISINENGITPDVEVVRTEDDIQKNKDPQLDKAIEIIKKL
ncbi:MAG: carboxyl-terminal processing protease [Parcubacteria group bacterium Licking1014_17]|nr:MAG: carboxyl-terminal processing protease [Parcubacteria group bacterium Licking1014_17]